MTFRRASRFKGYEDFTVQDLRIEPRVVCYRRERWLTPDGRTVLAPLPAGIGDHFGPEIKRFILAQYHQGQTTVPRLVELLQTLGIDISKRQVVRILSANRAELLRVLDRPDIPLHTNGSENDIRCQVIRRKVSGTTRSDDGRDCRDAFLSLYKTCRKLGISFWDYLGSRLGADVTVPSLPQLVATRCAA